MATRYDRDIDRMTGHAPSRWEWVGRGIIAGICLASFCTASRATEPPPVIQPIGTAAAGTPRPHRFDPGIVGPMCVRPSGMVQDELGALIAEPASEAESVAVVRAIDGCGQTSRSVADAWLVLALYRLAPQIGVPEEYRQILAACWCREASMRTESPKGGPVRGDWHERQAMAAGPFQLHSNFRDACGGIGEAGADDLLTAARCYWSRVLAKVEAVRERCPKHAWRVAEALTASPGYAKAGCSAATSHWEIMWRMQ